MSGGETSVVRRSVRGWQLAQARAALAIATVLLGLSAMAGSPLPTLAISWLVSAVILLVLWRQTVVIDLNQQTLRVGRRVIPFTTIRDLSHVEIGPLDGIVTPANAVHGVVSLGAARGLRLQLAGGRSLTVGLPFDDHTVARVESAMVSAITARTRPTADREADLWAHIERTVQTSKEQRGGEG